MAEVVHIGKAAKLAGVSVDKVANPGADKK